MASVADTPAGGRSDRGPAAAEGSAPRGGDRVGPRSRRSPPHSGEAAALRRPPNDRPPVGRARIGAILWPIATALVVAAIVFSRNADGFLHPVLFGEDGTQLFAFYDRERGFDAVLRSYAGYVSLVPNLLGWFVGALPLGQRPYALAAFAGVLAVAAFSTFVSRRFESVLPKIEARAAICVALAALPLGNFPLILCTMFSYMHLLWIAVLFALAQPPSARRSVASVAVETLLLAACLWSNPLSLALVPVYVWRAVQSARAAEDPARLRATVYFASLAVLGLAYQVLLVEHGAAMQGERPILAVLAASAVTLTDRVLAEAVVGLWWRLEIPSIALQLAIALPLAVFATHRLRTAPAAARRFALGLAFVLVAMTVLATYGRFERLAEFGEWGQRYTYVQRLAWITVLGLVVVEVVQRAGVARHGATEARIFPRQRALAFATALCAWALALHVANRGYYRTSREQGDRVVAFCRDAEAWRTDPGREPRDEFVLVEARRRIVLTRDDLAPAGPPR
jgi:hypothetical protein